MKEGRRLDQFKLPRGFRGRSAIFVQAWWIVEATLFRFSPQILYPLRVWLLRCFGARIGSKVKIRSSVSITYPWKLSIGNHSWVGDDVVLYSLGAIYVGSNTVISQGTYVCAADHDPNSVDFAIRARPVEIADGVWIAARCFVMPGTTIERDVVVGAMSLVRGRLLAGRKYSGNPAVTISETD